MEIHRPGNLKSHYWMSYKILTPRRPPIRSHAVTTHNTAVLLITAGRTPDFTKYNMSRFLRIEYLVSKTKYDSECREKWENYTISIWFKILCSVTPHARNKAPQLHSPSAVNLWQPANGELITIELKCAVCVCGMAINPWIGLQMESSLSLIMGS